MSTLSCSARAHSLALHAPVLASFRPFFIQSDARPFTPLAGKWQAALLCAHMRHEHHVQLQSVIVDVMAEPSSSAATPIVTSASLPHAPLIAVAIGFVDVIISVTDVMARRAPPTAHRRWRSLRASGAC